MFDFSPLAGTAGGTPMVILLAILVLDLVLGFVPQMGHLHPPLPGLRPLIAELERRLNRDKRSEANRIIRGAVLVLLGAVVAAALGWGLWRVAVELPFGIAVEVVVLFLAISQSRALGVMGEVADALQDGDETAARASLTTILPGDHDGRDAFALARVSIEEGARGLLKRMITPAFWYCLAGLPGVLAYGTVRVMAEVLIRKSGKAEAFALASSQLYDALGYLPARLAGAILLLASVFLPGARPGAGIDVLRRHGSRYPGPNGGWQLATAAGVLGLALCSPGGPSGVRRAQGGWIGDGRARANAVDVRRAIYLYGICGLITAALAAGLVLVLLTP
jgi:adenosylcobinamide-phosphate synthase